MGTLFVDKLDPQSGTSLEIGSSGDTITIPSGATITNSGTATGFGGGNLELITTSSTTSGVGSITVDNIFSTTYNVYKIFVRNLRPATNQTTVRMNIIKSDGSVYTSAAHKLIYGRIRSEGVDSSEDDNSTYFTLNGDTYKSMQQGGANIDMTCNLFRSATGDEPAFTFNYQSATARNNNEALCFVGSGYVNGKNSDINPRGMYFAMNSGNIDEAYISVYGVKGSV